MSSYNSLYKLTLALGLVTCVIKKSRAKNKRLVTGFLFNYELPRLLLYETKERNAEISGTKPSNKKGFEMQPEGGTKMFMSISFEHS